MLSRVSACLSVVYPRVGQLAKTLVTPSRSLSRELSTRRTAFGSRAMFPFRVVMVDRIGWGSSTSGVACCVTPPVYPLHSFTSRPPAVPAGPAPENRFDRARPDDLRSPISDFRLRPTRYPLLATFSLSASISQLRTSIPDSARSSICADSCPFVVKNVPRVTSHVTSPHVTPQNDSPVH